MTVQYVGTYSTLCIGEWEYTHLCACIYEHKRQKERVWDKGKKRGLKEALCFTSLYFTTKHKRKNEHNCSTMFSSIKNVPLTNSSSLTLQTYKINPADFILHKTH